MVELWLVEFPADDPERARRFWEGLLGVPFAEREDGEGRGRQTREGGVALGLHERGPGPGDRFSLPYFAVADVGEALARVQALGGEVVHPGEQWAICRDSEGSPFGLAAASGPLSVPAVAEESEPGVVVRAVRGGNTPAARSHVGRTKACTACTVFSGTTGLGLYSRT